MRKLYLLSILIFLTATRAEAATFISFEPVETHGKVVVWLYNFSYQGPNDAAPRIVSGHQNACDRPINHVTGEPLLPVPNKCFNTEAEARVEAQKDADKFEDWQYTQNGTPPALVPARKLWRKMSGQ